MVSRRSDTSRFDAQEETFYYTRNRSINLHEHGQQARPSVTHGDSPSRSTSPESEQLIHENCNFHPISQNISRGSDNSLVQDQNEILLDIRGQPRKLHGRGQRFRPSATYEDSPSPRTMAGSEQFFRRKSTIRRITHAHKIAMIHLSPHIPPMFRNSHPALRPNQNKGWVGLPHFQILITNKGRPAALSLPTRPPLPLP